MKLNEKRGLAILKRAEDDGLELLYFSQAGSPDKPMYAGAILGLGCRCGQVPLVVYSSALCIEWLVRYEKMTFEEATEWFDFNTSGAWMGEQTPMLLEDQDPG